MIGIVKCDECGMVLEDTVGDGDCPTCLLRFGESAVKLQSAVYPSPESLAGRLPDFEVVELIGRGGMGAVYRARQKSLDRHVAIKVLLEHAATHVVSAERFVRESRALAKLHHQNIITAHDAGEVDGLAYIVMQLVDGCDLKTLVAESGPVGVEEAIDWTIQAARGLRYAHGKGIVHRDIKPGNLLVDEDGVLRVLDLGLARIVTPDDSSDPGIEAANQHLTDSMHVLGTVDFMAPEQAVRTRDADERSDIYSLGCTLYYLLTGKTLFGGESVVERIVAHREQPRPSLRGMVPERFAALADVHARMTAREPSDRQQTMQQVIEELDAIRKQKSLDGDDTFQIPQPSATTAVHNQATEVFSPSPPARSSRLVRYVAFGLVGLLLAALSVSYWIRTDKGALLVRVDESIADELNLHIDRNGIEIRNLDGNSSEQLRPGKDKSLPSGTWQLRPIDGLRLSARNQQGVELDTDRFLVRRNDRIVIEVTRSDLRIEAGAAPAEPSVLEILTSDEWTWTAPENLGPAVNSRGDDGHPVLSADGLTLVFHSERNGGSGDRDLWISRRENLQTPWSPATIVGPPVNSQSAEHRPCLADAGRTLIFQRGGPGFAVRNGAVSWRASGVELWTASRDGVDSEWSDPTLLMPGMAPVLSENQLSLFYTDQGQIVQLTRSAVAAEWERVSTNLPADSFMTWLSHDERIALLSHANSRALEPFSLCLVTRDSVKEPWSEPVMLRAPIDDAYSLFGGSLSRDGRTLVFSSFRKGGVGAEDLWVSHRVRRTTTD